MSGRYDTTQLEAEYKRLFEAVAEELPELEWIDINYKAIKGISAIWISAKPGGCVLAESLDDAADAMRRRLAAIDSDLIEQRRSEAKALMREADELEERLKTQQQPQ